jgi:hypothetical protein
MKTINMKIKEIKGDGNCLYRAIADQIYGIDSCFELVKSKCMDYLELEKDFFSQFIDGGKEKFDEYILMKRMDGVWGDDIEIQALSELYNRPIEIFSHSKEPLKTFHENPDGFNRSTRESISKSKIRISYHGKAHYNSLIPTDQYENFKNELIKTQPGEYENAILEKVKWRVLQEKERRLKEEEASFSNKKGIDELDSQLGKIVLNNNENNNPNTILGMGDLEWSRGIFLEKSKHNI